MICEVLKFFFLKFVTSKITIFFFFLHYSYIVIAKQQQFDAEYDV